MNPAYEWQVLHQKLHSPPVIRFACKRTDNPIPSISFLKQLNIFAPLFDHSSTEHSSFQRFQAEKRAADSTLERRLISLDKKWQIKRYNCIACAEQVTCSPFMQLCEELWVVVCNLSHFSLLLIFPFADRFCCLLFLPSVSVVCFGRNTITIYVFLSCAGIGVAPARLKTQRVQLGDNASKRSMTNLIPLVVQHSNVVSGWYKNWRLPHQILVQNAWFNWTTLGDTA